MAMSNWDSMRAAQLQSFGTGGQPAGGNAYGLAAESRPQGGFGAGLANAYGQMQASGGGGIGQLSGGQGMGNAYGLSAAGPHGYGQGGGMSPGGQANADSMRASYGLAQAGPAIGSMSSGWNGGNLATFQPAGGSPGAPTHFSPEEQAAWRARGAQAAAMGPQSQYGAGPQGNGYGQGGDLRSRLASWMQSFGQGGGGGYGMGGGMYGHRQGMGGGGMYGGGGGYGGRMSPMQYFGQMYGRGWR